MREMSTREEIRKIYALPHTAKVKDLYDAFFANPIEKYRQDLYDWILYVIRRGRYTDKEWKRIHEFLLRIKTCKKPLK